MDSESLLARLRGTELGQVWFVRDHLQLIFEGVPDHWSWQCFVWPLVEWNGRIIAYPDPGYRDSICSFIGETVHSCEESGVSGLTVSFEGGAIVLNPTVEEIEGPEIAMLHPLDGPGEWMVWRPGEGTFARLD